MMYRTIGRLALVCLILLGGIAEASDPVAVTSCGQVVDGDGFLAADLDCSAYGPTAIQMDGNGTLDLGGFTLSAGVTNGIACFGRCTIINGTVEGAGQYGIKGFGNLVVNNLTVRGCDRGVNARRLEVTLLNSVDNRFGVEALKKVTVTDSSFVGNWKAVFGARSAKLLGTTISAASTEDGSRGVNTHRRAIVVDSTIGGVKYAVTATRAKIDNSAIVDNGWGVWADAIKLIDTSVSGNGISPLCSSSCADLTSTAKPRLRNSTCGTSYDLNPGGTNWGVCALD